MKEVFSLGGYKAFEVYDKDTQYRIMSEDTNTLYCYYNPVTKLVSFRLTYHRFSADALYALHLFIKQFEALLNKM